MTEGAAGASAKVTTSSRDTKGREAAGRGTSLRTGWPCRRWRITPAASGYVCAPLSVLVLVLVHLQCPGFLLRNVAAGGSYLYEALS